MSSDWAALHEKVRKTLAALEAAAPHDNWRERLQQFEEAALRIRNLPTSRLTEELTRIQEAFRAIDTRLKLHLEHDENLTNRLKQIADTAALIRRALDTKHLQALEQVRIELLGKSGEITRQARALGDIDENVRKQVAAILNVHKANTESVITTVRSNLEADELDARLATERVDVTLPARPDGRGRIHPLSQCAEEATAIFGEMGFTVVDGPEIESDFHNFTALNMPLHHPSRDMQDSFYFEGRTPGTVAEEQLVMLRTHTSNAQVRTMLKQKPPIRIVNTGRVFRRDYDATHAPMFHQIEGLVVDEKTHMGHLKGCLLEFCRAYFEVDDVSLQFRPSYFPFTEPSAEVDIGYSAKGGEMRFGGTEQWLEILGCGMVHPNVLRICGIDPERYQGFAFGMGLERITMLKYGIPDLRLMFESDVRWLRHYGFMPLDVPSLVGGLGQ